MALTLLASKPHAKCKPLCASLLSLLAVVGTRFPSSATNLVSGLQQLLLGCEHATGPLADLVHLLVSQHDNARLATDIVTELAEMNLDNSKVRGTKRDEWVEGTKRIGTQ